MAKTYEQQVSLKHPFSLNSRLCKIFLKNSQRDLPLELSEVKRAVSFLLEMLRISTDEITFHFVTDKKIRELHKDFFNDPTTTDCITFPMDSFPRANNDYHILGEIFICPKTVLTYAKKHKIAPQEELLRYMIHGLLHLVGYDDLQPDLRKKMKRKESLTLKKVLLAKPALVKVN